MYTQRIVRLSQFTRSAAGTRLLHRSAPAFAAPESHKPGKDTRLSQGTVSRPGHQHPGDAHDQAARSGQKAHQSDTTPVDAAERHSSKQAQSHLKGNPEGVGFADQVGSQSSTASVHEGRGAKAQGSGGEEEATPPGFVDAVKSKLGMKTSAGDVKQNREGGVGVTGTGATSGAKKPSEGRREMHWSAISRADTTTKGQAPEKSRMPQDNTYGDQNPHLKHKTEGDRDHGKGNAAPDPKLPSHQFSDSRANAAGGKQQKRAFMTSARAYEEKETKHTAESYFKDVDSSPPQSDKTHQVDGGASGPNVVRPHESNDPPTGGHSRAGPHTSEYETMSKEEPYDTLPSHGQEKDEKLRYGNMPGLQSKMSGDGGGESVSKEREGPQAEGAGGRKPEKAS